MRFDIRKYYMARPSLQPHALSFRTPSPYLALKQTTSGTQQRPAVFLVNPGQTAGRQQI